MKNSLDCKKLLSYGKELSIFAGILLVLLFVFSCNNILMRNSGSLVITVPGARAASASTFTIELASASGFTQSETISGGSTIQFDDLAPDTYTINVKGMDDAGNKVLSGTAKATVTAGETESVTVDLESSLGNLTVSFEGAESDSVAKYTVILSGPNESKKTQEVTDRSVQFEGFIPGDYNISVLGQDSAGTIVLSGTAKATVVEGQPVTAPVPLQDKLGKLSVEFTVPDDSTATSYTVEITGANSVTQSKPVSDGTSVLFEGLIPGEYTITVNGINANTVVLSGSVKATVIEGQTVPVTVPLQDKLGKLSVEFTVPDGSNANSFTVEITGANSVTHREPVSDGTSALFEGLIPGEYTITVNGINAADTVVLSGSVKATVVEGQTVPATVPLQEEVGRLSVEFTVPGDSNATSYTVKITHSEDKEFSKEEPISDGTSVLFNDLIPGSYTISVHGMNADTVVLYGTTTSDEVAKGEESSATVNLTGVVNDFTALQGAISNGGIIYVGSDIEINETITATPSTPVTIQAAYKDVTLSWTGTSSKPMFQPTGGNWTFGGGEYSITLKGNSNSSHLIDIISAEVTLTSNGSIEINSGYEYGVAIGQESSTTTNKSVFHLDGGKIIGRADTSVVVYGNSQFIMKEGSITATASVGVRVNAGSVFSMTGGDILNSTNDVIVENSGLFTISGKVQVGTIKLNGVGNYFTVGGELEGNSTVATITPGRYNSEEVVVKVAEGSDVALAEVATRFNVTPNGNTLWAIDPDTGKLVQQ